MAQNPPYRYQTPRLANFCKEVMPERAWVARPRLAWSFVLLISNMPLFSITNGSAKKIPPTPAGLERNVQRLFEKNLAEILNITFLASEHVTSFGGRIDTLGIDNNGSPAIIEYKRTQNDSVINQGLSYLHWLLDHRADFEALVRKAGVTVEVDWASPRVICVAESYNKFDLDTVALLPIDIELLRYRIYGGDILLVEPEVQRKVKISTSEIFEKTGKQRHEFKDHVKHTVEDHVKSANDHIRELFTTLREKIMALDDAIVEEPKAHYIAYKLTNNFVDITIQKDSLKLFLNIPSGELTDPGGIARDLTKPKPIGHWGNGDYEVKLDRSEDVDAVMALINQSYSYNR